MSRFQKWLSLGLCVLLLLTQTLCAALAEGIARILHSRQNWLYLLFGIH